VFKINNGLVCQLFFECPNIYLVLSCNWYICIAKLSTLYTRYFLLSALSCLTSSYSVACG
jgi:hypothetical protein